MIRVYDDAGNVIETHEHAGEFKEWWARLPLAPAEAVAELMWAVAAIVLLVCGISYGEDPATHFYNHRYVRNTTLPPDCVELAVDSPSQGFYRTPPKERPDNVPPTYVLVRVFVQDGQFIGWIYMEADVVRFLHGQPIHRAMMPSSR